jgi:hypothetical protein
VMTGGVRDSSAASAAADGLVVRCSRCSMAIA